VPNSTLNAQAIDDSAERVVQSALIDVAWAQRHEQQVIFTQ
jgi:hypothetical protein